MITEKINYWVMPGLVRENPPEIKTLDEILNHVCDYYQLPRIYVESQSRRQDAVLARHTFCWLSRMMTKKSTTDIGEFINRDHASVIHAYKQINNYIYLNSINGARANNMLTKLMKAI